MPVAVVISAPVAYIKVVSIKKLIIRFQNGPVGPLQGESLTSLLFFSKTVCALY